MIAVFLFTMSVLKDSCFLLKLETITTEAEKQGNYLVFLPNTSVNKLNKGLFLQWKC